MDAIAVRDMFLQRQAYSGNIIRSFARGGDQPWRKILHQRIVRKQSLKLRSPLPQHKRRGIGVEAQKQAAQPRGAVRAWHESLPHLQADG